MTAPKTRRADRRNGRCRACLSWDVEIVRDGLNKGALRCRQCGHVHKPRGFRRIVAR